MATRYNYTGGIVTDGLVLNLDAAKVDSYPGAGTTWYDISGNNNNGTLTNGPTFSGIGKQASIVFDGVDDFVDLGINNIFTSSSIFTVDLWIKVNAITVEQMIFANSSNNNTGWHIELFNSRPIFQIYPSTEYFQTTSTLTSNVWTNITAVYNNKILTWYKNGSFDVTQTYINNFTPTTGPTYIGRWPYSAAYPFGGKSSIVKFYSRALSADEVSQNFNALRGRYGI